MKKMYLIAAIMLLGVASMSAASYQHAIGGYVGGMNGVSYKGFIFGNDNLALQTDLIVRLESTAGSIGYYANGESESVSFSNGNFYTFEANPNIVYQNTIHEFNFASLDWYVGGGVSLGLMNGFSSTSSSSVLGKWGLNAIGGLELAFSNIPLSVGFDFRPGYGMGFGGKSMTEDEETSVTSLIHFFDWGMGVSVRYCF